MPSTARGTHTQDGSRDTSINYQRLLLSFFFYASTPTFISSRSRSAASPASFFFILSLTFFTCAAPTPNHPRALALRGRATAAGVALEVVADVHAKSATWKLVPQYALLILHPASLADIDAAKVRVDDILVDIKVAADAIVKLGTNIYVAADIKAKIAAEIAAIIQIVVKISALLVAKLGDTVALLLCVQIDAV
ncbi:hypothetical protein FRC11_012294, partial [Ceratobasidium sp. 423]